MSFSKSAAFVSALAFVAKVSAHGFVTGIVADGTYFSGYNPNYQYMQTPPSVAGWSDPLNQANGYVNDYSSPDIICHLSATPGQAYATVAAGGTVELQWTAWPASHRGPVMTYLANCNGECTDVDKTTLLWNKIDEAGLTGPSANPQTWASDEMIANNNTWALTVPSTIAPGKYVLRHETIALHSAGTSGGAQNYPQCVNLEITGSGSDSLTGGTAYNDLYTATDPGILVNIYQTLTSYIIPGPALIDGSSSNGTTSASSTPVSSSTAVVTSSAAPFSNSTTTAAAVTATTSKPTTFLTVTKSSISVTSAPDTNVAIPTATATSAASTSSSTSDDGPTITGKPTAVSTSAASTATTITATGSNGRKFVCYEEE